MQEVQWRQALIPMDSVMLQGDLAIPNGAYGIVLFAHGSGSGRHSPRNRFVAEQLRMRGVATLLMDLLTEQEEIEEAYTRHLRFDIELLAGRLIAATDWVADQAELADARIGYFGASTGAGAALVASARLPGSIAAVVSRGGRPDLAGAALDLAQPPTLLIVGSHDPVVLDLNRDALRRMERVGQGLHRLDIVPGASHLFEEPGTLEEVARLAGDWFEAHLRPQASAIAA